MTPPLAMDLIVRSALPLETMATIVRTVGASIDPDLVASELRPLEDLVDRAVSPRRFLAQLVGGFSLLALALASAGIYGVVSYTVSQRVHEIGVRIALGATGRDVRRHVLAGTLRDAAIVLAAGMAAAAGLVTVLTSQLYETSPYDLTSFAGPAAVLLTVALAAGYAPALRASRVDPVSALRVE